MTEQHATADSLVELPSGMTICYRTDGDTSAEPIVLIAGLGQQLTVWPTDLVDGLVARGFFVVRLDNRDAGRSGRDERPAPGKLDLLRSRALPGAYDLSDMAGDVLGLLDHLGLERVHLVGQSMGGMIAQTVAATAPNRVASLTSIYSTTGHPKVGQASLKTKLLIARPGPRTAEEYVDGHLRMTTHLSGRGYPLDPDVERAYAAEAWTRAGGANARGFARQIGAIMASGDRTEQVRAITAPTLVIHGDRDPIVNPSGGRATADAIPGARLVSIVGMGHHLAPGLVEQYVDLISQHGQGVHA